MAPFDVATDPVNAWPMDEQQPPHMSEEELIVALKREADAADSEFDRLRGLQDLAQSYYEGKPFGNEVDGRSQIVLPDVQEVIDYMVTSVLRTFISGDRVVEFEGTDEGEEDSVDDATAAVNYSFMRRQDGYRVLHDWLTCGLLEKYGVTKTMSVPEVKIRREQGIIHDPVQLEGIDAEIEGVTENPDGTLTVSLKHEHKTKRFLDVSVPAHEFRFSPRARHEDDADYLAHCPVKTRSDLVDMGFDREQVYNLPAYSRMPGRDDSPYYDNVFSETESSDALEQVQLWEEYARIDLDGDGIAERVKVFRVEHEILRWADGELAIETVDEQPFSVFCPFPRPHRLVGYSLAEKTMDIQLARSTIARQLFDGMYNANMPRPVVVTRGMDENTLDDILSPITGSPIRVAEAGAVMPYQTGFDVGQSLTVLEWVTGERESRTGITRLNQGLQADALNKTATGTAMMQAQGQQQEEFIARNLAEAFSRLMAKKYRLMKKEGEPFNVKVDGKYKQVDPSQWPDDVNVVIRVGLGTGSKDKRINARLQLVPMLEAGAAAGHVTDKHLFHAMDGLVRDLGLGQGDDFWVDPDAPPEVDPQTGQPKQPPAPMPSPQDQKAQADVQKSQQDMQIAQQKHASELQMAQQKHEAAMQQIQQKAELEAQKVQADIATKQQSDAGHIDALQQKHVMEMEQKHQQMAAELQLAREKADADYQLALHKIATEAEVAKHGAQVKGHASVEIAKNAPTIPQDRPGGALDQ